MPSSVCVFCGSNPGFDPEFQQAAVELGTAMGRRGIRLVYGGSHLGMMGAMADAVLAAGGEVTGVVPRLLVVKEAAHLGLNDLRVVETMHARKALMVDLSAAFVVLPGAYGTLDELFECVTWAQLGIHEKPIVIWNVKEYFQPLLVFLDSAVAAGLLRPQHRELLRVSSSLEETFRLLEEPVEVVTDKWLPPAIR